MKHIKGEATRNFISRESLFVIPLAFQFIVPVILIIAGVCAYAPSLSYDFQFDDLANILKLWDIRHAKFFDLCMSHSRWISYWLNTIHYAIGKFNPLSYRIGNLIIHFANAFSIYTLLYSLLPRSSIQFFSRYVFHISGLTTLFFILHPVQTQTVSYVIQGQLEGLAASATLCTLLCFVSYLTARSSFKKNASLFGIFLLAVLGSGTKEIFIVTPFLLALVDWYFFAQGSFKELYKRWWVHGIATGIIFVLYLYFLKPTFFWNLLSLKMEMRNNIGNLLTADPSQPIRPLHFCISQFKVIIHYLFIFLWPGWISVEYDWKLVDGFFAPDCIIPFLGLLTLAIVLYIHSRHKPRSPIVFAALWFAICIAPRASFIPSSELLVDYKTYLASATVLLMIASALIACTVWFIEKISPHNSKINFYLFVLWLLAFPLGYGTYIRNKVWRSPEEFWMNMIENAPCKARAYNNYGVALSEKNKFKESIPFYEQAIKMDPNYPDPLNNVAVAYGFLGEVDKAIEVLYKSAAMQPYAAEPFNNLATFFLVKQEYEKAEAMIAESLKRRPYYGKAFINRGKLEMARGNKDAAVKAFRDACTIADNDNAEGYRVYSLACMQMQRFKDAIEAFDLLCKVSPTVDNFIDRANCFFFDNQFEQAEKEYEKLTAQFKDDRPFYNLAETRLRLKKYALALDTFIQLMPKLEKFPHLLFRIATCQKELGNIDEAITTLARIENESSIDQQNKQNARIYVAQLKSLKEKNQAKIPEQGAAA